MHKHLMAAIVAAGLLGSGTAAAADDYVVQMKDKKFSVVTLKRKVGDTVTFKNMDPYNHNVFSLSDTQTFDLGSYPQGQAKKITLNKNGTIEVECAIHPDMKLTIEVSK